MEQQENNQENKQKKDLTNHIHVHKHHAIGLIVLLIILVAICLAVLFMVKISGSPFTISNNNEQQSGAKITTYIKNDQIAEVNTNNNNNNNNNNIQEQSIKDATNSRNLITTYVGDVGK